MAAIVAWWVRFYTRNLPEPIARRRIDEIDADLHDHIAHERAHGTRDPRIAIGIAARMARGMAADASWSGRMSTNRTAHRPAIRVALVTMLVLLVPLFGMQVSDEVNWSLADFVLAGALLAGTGLLLELAARRPGKVVYRAAAIAIALAAIVLGEADDAPGLVLFGGLVIIGTVALAARAAMRSD